MFSDISLNVGLPLTISLVIPLTSVVDGGISISGFISLVPDFIVPSVSTLVIENSIILSVDGFNPVV